MGNGNSINLFSTKRKQLLVRTGSQKGKGTDANVCVILFDNNGRKTKTILLDCKFRDDFKNGHTDNFPINLISVEGKPLGDVTEIELWRDEAGLSSDWFCDVIFLMDLEAGQCKPFPVQRWVRPNFHYKIKAYDTILPQDDPNKFQRSLELQYKQTLYKYSEQDTGLPGLIEKIPTDEEFSTEYYLNVLIGTTAQAQFVNIFVNASLPSEWNTVEDIKKAFANNTYELPKCAEWWNDDEWFAAQRLTGINPSHIELCTNIPIEFAVSKKDLRPLIEGRNLDDVLKEKKLFIVDYRILDGIKGMPNKTVVSPICLFYLNTKGTLLPVAIQLFSKPGPENPVFYPSDDHNVWIMAKLWFNMAAGSFHHAVDHLGLTHLAMEAVCIATHRCLAPNHPVFRLLAPHYFYLFAVNQSGLNNLVAEGTTFDTLTNIGSQGGLQLFQRIWKNWRLNMEGTFPKNLESRGVLDEAVLPNYPYRDDGILVYNIIKNYVTNVLNIYYVDDRNIKIDKELQNWAKLLSTPVEQDGAGIRGIPNDGNLQTIDDVGTICTNVIFICSAQHATVNFSFFELFAFAPNMPLSLKGGPPKDKHPINQAEIVKCLPDKENLLYMMRLSRTLSMRASNKLGDWDMRFQYDRDAVAAEDRMREELFLVSKKIKERNKSRSKYLKYEYLDPELIPNSIAI